ncbi:MAG: M3 family oligoendopeptidase, partial [Clostridia bacterium]|nr:M3 family oligoendopeptidase [Clostridia bacterium]
AIYEKISPELEAQYGELVKLRNEMALKMGFKNYTDMAYINRNRFDYKQEDAAKFREQVREIITPAVAKIRKVQQEKLGLDKLYYYDEELNFPDGNAAPIGTAKELVDKAQKMYREMSAFMAG